MYVVDGLIVELQVHRHAFAVPPTNFLKRDIVVVQSSKFDAVMKKGPGSWYTRDHIKLLGVLWQLDHSLDR
ncbi:hypothetical protein AW878_10760 [Bordetella pseudohinzii]|uniref:Uncharacterized protein n=1 Tax=Bordetella pseudohinzii TaxID=1331258 RepID=A0ABM6DAH3_9BORD|nr:hypothetical protein BBN53_00065 [Bordetella pseudohinzii]KMM26598.1 hypothetical protein L540_11965 [Bordetella pseudohinzii]KXA79215.1 hypothetical protein AW878_10760 [Bordetella pseudohinzii]